MDNLLVDENWRKLVERGTSKRDLFGSSFSPFDAEKFANDYIKRDNFRHSVSWHIPTSSLIDLLKEFSPIVSIGAGFAYTESIASEKGADIIATDIQPNDKNKWCTKGEFYMEVEKLSGVEAVEKYSSRNVFMAWPPYDNPMAYEVALNMEIGKTLVFVGESYGGCTADDNFFQYLASNFEEQDTEANIPSWSGIYDNVQVYKKIK